MIKKNKYLIGFVFLMIVLLVPKGVLAQGYVQYSDFKNNGSELQDFYENSMNDRIEYNINETGNFSFRLTGFNLESNTNYVLTLKSDFTEVTYNYSGQELSDGVSVDILNTKGIFKGTLKQGSNIIKAKKGESLYSNIYFYFDDSKDLTELDHFKDSISKNGTIKLDSIDVRNDENNEGAITYALSKYQNSNFKLRGYCDEKCYVEVEDVRYINHIKEYEVNYDFKERDDDIKKRIDKYMAKLSYPMSEVFDKSYVLEDLELVNFNLSALNIDHNSSVVEFLEKYNLLVNYSSQLQKQFTEPNIFANLDLRGASGTTFNDFQFGYLNLLYGDIAYGTAYRVGFKEINAIYVPDNTPNNRKSYIKAAKDRLKKYFKNVDVEIIYAGQLSDLDDYEYDFIDSSKTLGEYYILKLNDVSLKYFIVKDSSKMNKPFYKALSKKTNIYITTDNGIVAPDTEVVANEIKSGSEEYASIIKKLNVDKGMVLDLKLFSESENKYITHSDNDKFKVHIPISGLTKNSKLTAYHINDSGEIETYDVLVENGYAIFETDHFSIYTLAIKKDVENTNTNTLNNKNLENKSDKVKTTTKNTVNKGIINNPKTSDNILKYMILLIISFSSLFGVGIKYKKLK